MVEFALVLPLLLLVIFGIIELGRLFIIYSSVVTASAEAVRYGATVGEIGADVARYKDCAGIRAAAKRVGAFAGIQDTNITISYDHGPNTNLISSACPVSGSIYLGDRLVVRTQINYQPFMALVNLPSFPISATSARTLIKDVTIQGTPPTPYPSNTPIVPVSAPSDTPTPSKTPTATKTATPTNTPTKTSTPTPTATHTAGPSPTSTNTPSPTPTLTPTFTATSTNTATPSPTPTPVCPQGAIVAVVESSRQKLKWTITDMAPTIPVEISQIFVEWPVVGEVNLKSMTFAGIDEGATAHQNWLPPSKSFVYDPPASVTFGTYQQDLVLTFSHKMEAGMYHVEISFAGTACQAISLNYYYTP